MSIIDYDRVNFQNLPSLQTPVDEDNLNKMDKAIDDIANYINKSRIYILNSTAWVATSNETYPYKMTISSYEFSDDDTPICQVWGVNEIENEDEMVGISYIKKVIVNSTGITVYASNRPTVNLKLVLKV